MFDSLSDKLETIENETSNNSNQISPKNAKNNKNIKNAKNQKNNNNKQQRPQIDETEIEKINQTYDFSMPSAMRFVVSFCWFFFFTLCVFFLHCFLLKKKLRMCVFF